jgi:hypothetical protein
MSMQPKSAGGIVAIIVAILIMSVLTAWFNGARNPVAHVPTPVMPRPNAFDDFQAAANSFRDEDLVANALMDPAAAKSVGLTVAPTAEQIVVAGRDAAIVRQVRIGCTYAYQAPPIRHFTDRVPYLSKFRGLARLMMFEGKIAQRRGDWQAAADYNVDCVVFGDEIMHGSALFGTLVGLACNSIGRRDCWFTVSHLDSSAAKAEALRLQASLASRPPASQIVQEEEWSGQSCMADPRDSEDLYGMATCPSFVPEGACVQAVQTIYPKRVIFANYTRYMDQMVSLSRLPYPESAATKLTIPDDPFYKDMLMEFDKYSIKETSDRTFTSLLMASFALRAYRLDHGAYPHKLSDIVPGYLNAVPIDPFSANLPMQYRLKGASYVLYSVGPDGVDNGGTPFVNRESLVYPTMRWCDLDTKGDIVAGLNPG